MIVKIGRVGLIEVLLGLLDWRTGGRYGLSSHMKWNESEASIGRVLAVEVSVEFVSEMFVMCVTHVNDEIINICLRYCMVLQQKEHIAQKCVRYLTRQK